MTAFSGDNFLHLLARHCGQLPIRKVGIFLENGVRGEKNTKNNFGQTPLHFSIMHNELRNSENPEKEKWFRFAEFLIDNGADLNTRAKSEVTPLMTAARGKGEGHGYVNLILSRNPSSMHDTDKFSRTVLHHCVIFATTQKFFQMIVNSEIDPDITPVNTRRLQDVSKTSFWYQSRRLQDVLSWSPDETPKDVFLRLVKDGFKRRPLLVSKRRLLLDELKTS